MDSLLSHQNPCHFLRAISYLYNPQHLLGTLIVCAETTVRPEGVLVSVEALSHLLEDGRACAEAIFLALGSCHFLQLDYCVLCFYTA